MWNLIYSHDVTKVISLFETDDTANVGTNDVLEQFATRGQALQRIDELGLVHNVFGAYDISKLTLRRRLRAAGLESIFDAALTADPQAAADWADAQCINTGDQLVLKKLPALQAALGMSDAAIDALIVKE